jgi:hypothetical protein
MRQVEDNCSGDVENDECSEDRERSRPVSPKEHQQQKDVAQEAGRPEEANKSRQLHLSHSIWATIRIGTLGELSLVYSHQIATWRWRLRIAAGLVEVLCDWLGDFTNLPGKALADPNS